MSRWPHASSTIAALALLVAAPAAAVVGGAVDADDRAVVVIDVGGFRFCSGAVVGPRAVLTAGHCVIDVGGVPLGVSVVGDDAETAVASFTVVQAVRHPDYAGEGKPADVALLQLDADVDVEPLAPSTHAFVDDDVGGTLRHVGYGVADEASGDGRGVRRTVDLPVTAVDDDFVYAGAVERQTCDGDSGGPALWRDDDGVERIAAVTSDGPSCHETGWDVRVDAVADFVTSTLAAWAPSDGAAAVDDAGGCAATPSTPIAVLLALVVRGRRRVRDAR
jgi:hypothetical protein